MHNLLPNSAGIGLKPEHFTDAKADRPCDIWFEVHPENYMIDGGPRLRGLLSICKDSPLSLHGVGASLGGPDLPDPEHLSALRRLIDLTEPASVSEHAVWSRFEGIYFADLIPLPRTKVAIQRLVNGIDCFQQGIGRKILVENPTNYLPVISEMDEPDFLVNVAKSAGCGLLIDINNLYLSSVNCGIDATAYIHAIPPELVGEIHIAGFDPDPNLGERFLVDSHASPVDQAVWVLLDIALAHFGPKSVLLERDSNLPSYTELLEERNLASQALNKVLNKKPSKNNAAVTA